MNTYGLIVGIDRYDEPQLSLSGPCRNALAIARWLVQVADPADIWLFLDPVDDLAAPIAALRAQGVHVVESAGWSDIDKFCFTTLPQDRPADSRLFFFWSGHGYVDSYGNRLFLCRDYTSQELYNRVFNGSQFLRHLRSPRFHSFAETLMLADVCGVHSDVRLKDPRGGPDSTGDAVLSAFFATPEGVYAHGDDGEGLFTSAAAGVLNEFKTWPELRDFSRRLLTRLDELEQAPFHVQAFDEKSELADRIVGKVSGSSLTTKLVALLDGEKVPPHTYLFHYRRAVDRLANPALNRAQGLTGMVGELASLQDSQPGHIAYGLLNFLVRLTQVALLAKKVNQWLEDNAPSQASTIEGIRVGLQSENLAWILLLDVQNDAAGEISGYEPYLRNRNLAPVPNQALKAEAFSGWKGFEAELKRLLTALGPSSIAQIHFLADPPLFDRPFYRIPGPGGLELGEEFVVYLRHRERLFSQRPNVREAWMQYADLLRQTTLDQMKIVPLPESATRLIGTDRGVCYFKQPLPTVESGPASLAEKMTLLRLLRLGVPYLCWLEAGDAAAWTRLVTFLSGGLANTKTLDTFPDFLTQQRTGQNELARGATLLWDDPGQNPFQ